MPSPTKIHRRGRGPPRTLAAAALWALMLCLLLIAPIAGVRGNAPVGQPNSTSITLRQGVGAYANLSLFPTTPPSQIDLYVNVSIEHTSQPLEGASVFVAWGSNDLSGTTTAQGSALFVVPFTSLDYSASASLYGYLENTTNFALSERPVQSVNVSLPIAPLTPLDVHLLDYDTHQSIEGGTVELAYKAEEVAGATSGATGWANLTSNVYPAAFVLTGNAVGYNTNITSITIAMGLKDVVLEMFLTPISGPSHGGGGSSSTNSPSAWNLVLLPHTAASVAYFLAIPVVIIVAALAYLGWMRHRDSDQEPAPPAQAEDSTRRPPSR
ncbi:MAG: hypothetical protein WB778_01245 [Thermoplasmata archaeon]